MPIRKYRRHIDTRLSSIAREVAQSAKDSPEKAQLQEALISVAVSACAVALQTQALAAVCKTASNAFARAFSGKGSEVASRSVEVFGDLSKNILRSGDGVLVESLETLVAIAAEALPSDYRLRTITTLAISSGLDPAQIALDYQEHTSDTPEESAQETEATVRQKVEAYTAIALDAFTEIAAVRGMTTFRIEHDDTKRFLIGHTGKTWLRVIELLCDEEECERVAEGVRNRIRARI
jgi:hypothetical protein